MRIPEAVLGMTVTGNDPQHDQAYLGAITYACGYVGMTAQRDPTEPTLGSGQSLDFELPHGLPQALRQLREQDKLRSVLGERFVDVYRAIKDQEHLEVMTVISPWEREHLLLHVQFSFAVSANVPFLRAVFPTSEWILLSCFVMAQSS